MNLKQNVETVTKLWNWYHLSGTFSIFRNPSKTISPFSNSKC